MSFCMRLVRASSIHISLHMIIVWVYISSMSLGKIAIGPYYSYVFLYEIGKNAYNISMLQMVLRVCTVFEYGVYRV